MTSSQVKTKPFDSWNYSEMEKEFPELIRSVGLLSVAPDSVPSNFSEAVSEEASQVSLSADDRGRSEENNVCTVEEQPGLMQGPSSSVEAPTNAVQPASEAVKQESDSSSQHGAKNPQPLACEEEVIKRLLQAS